MEEVINDKYLSKFQSLTKSLVPLHPNGLRVLLSDFVVIYALLYLLTTTTIDMHVFVHIRYHKTKTFVVISIEIVSFWLNLSICEYN